MLLAPWPISYKIAFFLTAIIGFAYHEFAHAVVADRLGDPTPRSHGRITPNPIVHLDLFGVIMLALVGFGWAVTPVNPNLLRGNPRRSMAIVAIAGPLANLFMAIVWGLPLRFGLVHYSPNINEFVPTFFELCSAGLQINLLLFVFNLIPIPPLDGFTILTGILPADLAYQLAPVRQYGQIILIALLILPSLAGFSILTTVINPITSTLQLIILGGG